MMMDRTSSNPNLSSSGVQICFEKAPVKGVMRLVGGAGAGGVFVLGDVLLFFLGLLSLLLMLVFVPVLLDLVVDSLVELSEEESSDLYFLLNLVYFFSHTLISLSCSSSKDFNLFSLSFNLLSISASFCSNP